MDLGLYARVLWRFKFVVLMGLVAAIGLAALSMLKISSSGVAYRQSILYSSTARLGVTQRGFPWGRLFAETPSATAQAAQSGIPVADPNRLNNLAVLYAELATSDPVRQVMLRDGPIIGKVLAAPVVRGDNQIMLPLVDLTAIATSPGRAIKLARRSAAALTTFITTQQRQSGVPDSDRVITQYVIDPRKAVVYQPRSKTMPIVVFLAVMFATTGLAFLLENLRPRTKAKEQDDATASNAPARLSA